MAEKLKFKIGKQSFEEEFEEMFEKQVTKFGTGAKIDASKKFLGKKVIVFVKNK